MNDNLTQALALQAAAQAAQNAATSIADYQAVVAQWVACGQAASNAGNDAAASADASETITITPSLKEIADANTQLANYANENNIGSPTLTLQLATEIAAESGTEAGYAIQGATAALNATQDVAGGVGPAPVVAPAASSSTAGVVGVVAGIGILGGLTWLAFRAIIPPLR